jgi:hypothetical protein
MAGWTQANGDEAPYWMREHGYELGPIPPWQREIIDTVVRDMQTPGLRTLRFAYEPDATPRLQRTFGGDREDDLRAILWESCGRRLRENRAPMARACKAWWTCPAEDSRKIAHIRQFPNELRGAA